ncbi:helix-hairpin-helix domain-containing protein [Corynebacteriaceae bacterium 7-707]
MADRVEALTQPVPGHELADVRFERRTVIGPRSARIMTATVAALVVVVGGVMLFNENTGDGGGDTVEVVAGLSPTVSGDAGVEPAGDTGKDGQDGDGGAVTGTTGRGEDTAGGGPVVVSVQGLVHRPGLVTVDAGTRAGEVIDRSGGVRGDGRVEGINLAEPVVDGMQIVVDPDGSRVLYPGQAGGESAGNKSPHGPSSPSADGGPPGDPGAGTVNINTADVTALTGLSGVGPATAEAIVGWRENHGGFAAVEQLMEVKGIGPAKFEALRDHVTV